MAATGIVGLVAMMAGDGWRAFRRANLTTVGGTYATLEALLADVARFPSLFA